MSLIQEALKRQEDEARESEAATTPPGVPPPPPPPGALRKASNPAPPSTSPPENPVSTPKPAMDVVKGSPSSDKRSRGPVRVFVLILLVLAGSVGLLVYQGAPFLSQLFPGESAAEENADTSRLLPPIPDSLSTEPSSPEADASPDVGAEGTGGDSGESPEGIAPASESPPAGGMVSEEKRPADSGPAEVPASARESGPGVVAGTKLPGVAEDTPTAPRSSEGAPETASKSTVRELEIGVEGAAVSLASGEGDSGKAFPIPEKDASLVSDGTPSRPVSSGEAAGGTAKGRTDSPVKWPRLVIRGVLESQGRGAVIVNNQVIGIGETIQGAKLIAVFRQGAEFSLDGETRMIRVGQGGDGP